VNTIPLGNELSVSIKGGVFLGQLTNLQFLTKNSASLSQFASYCRQLYRHSVADTSEDHKQHES